MKLRAVLLFSFTLAGALSGCAVKYGCPAPDGVTCKPISEVYSSNGGRGPGVGDRERPGPGSRDSRSAEENLSLTPGPRPPAPDSAAVPLRSAPKVLRVWVAPWIDEEGDLHQEGDLYVVVDHGAWAVGLQELESGLASRPGIIPPEGGLSEQLSRPERGEGDDQQ
ncbi:type IV conjugative transfer system lipoprotein TraV [Candidatus Manganitrophus noduliformans]|uniref:Type IV conjugative transfer system lipoprotein TraV n=1 Tax=Candidatus Manganitrophus noduliformans TaxID=2606439 RepID=A0A7X6DSZ7_9BACT|nr:type IV conjugative transfer system lipoprotein TraV [Candidatus Manganitrophus noduliformans]NKE72837.1 type IV conjugative transfer system lipoprotein TraV [Candidatus Manganitrophus noduliformans]